MSKNQSFVPEAGYQLHYVCCGEGAPLLLLHGNGEDNSYFENQIQAFAAYFTVYAVDTRGHGQSSRGKAPFTLSQFAVDLKQLVDQLGLPKVTLLGFSDGANIALLFALAYPDLVDRLILNGANLFPAGLVKSSLHYVRSHYWNYKLLSPFSAKARRQAELYRLMVKEPSIKPMQLLFIHVPVLVVAGDEDMIRESHTRLIYQSLPDARLSILPGSHFVARENPEEFNRRVLLFLLSPTDKG